MSPVGSRIGEQCFISARHRSSRSQNFRKGSCVGQCGTRGGSEFGKGPFIHQLQSQGDDFISRHFLFSRECGDKRNRFRELLWLMLISMCIWVIMSSNPKCTVATAISKNGTHSHYWQKGLILTAGSGGLKDREAHHSSTPIPRLMVSHDKAANCTFRVGRCVVTNLRIIHWACWLAGWRVLMARSLACRSLSLFCFLLVLDGTSIFFFTRGFLLTRTELSVFSNCSDIAKCPSSCFEHPFPFLNPNRAETKASNAGNILEAPNPESRLDDGELEESTKSGGVDNDQQCWTRPAIKKVVILIIDALRFVCLLLSPICVRCVIWGISPGSQLKYVLSPYNFRDHTDVTRFY